MISGPTRWYQVGAQLVTAVQAALSSPVGRAGQVPGEIAWDDCQCDGLLAVAVPRVFLAETFPAEAEAPVSSSCQPPFEIAEFTVAVLRCAPQPEGQDLSPTPAALDASAGLLLQDLAETMDALAAVLCTLRNADSISDYLITPGEAAGPQGACVGFNLTVHVGLERP